MEQQEKAPQISLEVLPVPTAQQEKNLNNPQLENEYKKNPIKVGQEAQNHRRERDGMFWDCESVYSLQSICWLHIQGSHYSNSNLIWREKRCLSKTHDKTAKTPRLGMILSTQPQCRSSQSIKIIWLWLQILDPAVTLSQLVKPSREGKLQV